MIPVNDNTSAAQAKYDLELALLNGTAWQLLSEDVAVADLEQNALAGYEFSVEWGKLIFAWWNESGAQSWRIAEYAIKPAELQLRAARSFGRGLTTLTLRDLNRWHTRPLTVALTAEDRRQHYAQLMLQLLTRHFANARCKTLAGTQQYARVWLRANNENVLAIGVNEAENQAEIDGIVAAGLVWLADFNLADFNLKDDTTPRAQRLCFCVPAKRSQTVIERLSLLDRQPFGARLECLELEEAEEQLRAVSLATQADLLTMHPRELHWPEAAPQINPWCARIIELAPDLIEAHPHPQLECDSFSIHGLEFARAHWRGLERVSFGVAGLPDGFAAPAGATLSEANFQQLESLVNQLARLRSAHSADRRHLFYRLRAEAWLESLLRRDIGKLDVTLDERFIYSQIPAWRSDERSVLDLLTVNHQGRLVVIEIKASEDAQLPLQGLDYWLRVEQARVRGEFAQRGLFNGIELADQTPLLYLVAPRLRFHRSFSTIACCIAPEIEAYRIGLNANWRAGVRVHTREHVNVERAG